MPPLAVRRTPVWLILCACFAAGVQKKLARLS
jgi:hypothetical protein